MWKCSWCDVLKTIISSIQICMDLYKPNVNSSFSILKVIEAFFRPNGIDLTWNAVFPRSYPGAIKILWYPAFKSMALNNSGSLLLSLLLSWSLLAWSELSCARELVVWSSPLSSDRTRKIVHKKKRNTAVWLHPLRIRP